jgi:hypothetical protein
MKRNSVPKRSMVPGLFLVRRLARCERGDSSPMAMVLVTTIVVIGVIVGLATIRDAVVQEYGDAAVLLDNLDQTVSVQVFDDGGNLVWEAQYLDNAATLTDPADAEPACLTISDTSVIDEGEALPGPTGDFP